MLALLTGAAGCSFSPAPVRLGDAGDQADAPPPEPPCAQGVTTAGQSGSAGHTCVPRADGRVMCFGRNDRGQLGDGTVVDRTTAEPARAMGIVSLAASSGHTCGHTNDGDLFCWGVNSDGQLGVDTAGAPQLEPAMVPLGTQAGAPAAGERHTCVVVAGNSVRCWGDNGEGQLGNGSTEDSLAPQTVFGLSGVMEVAAGQAHTCALTMNQQVYCWGRGSRGQLGDGDTMQQNQPVQAGVTGATALAAGWNHSCAISGTDVLCWGANDDGQLGSGDVDTHATPQTVMFQTAITPVAIAAGEAHTCVRTDAGEILCWGANRDGQLGNDGAEASQIVPLAPAGAGGWLDLAAGGAQTCARHEDDLAVWCWGDGAYGQLGYGGLLDQRVPVRATGLCVPIE